MAFRQVPRDPQETGDPEPSNHNGHNNEPAPVRSPRNLIHRMVRDMLFRRYHFENVSEIAEECGLDSHACVDIELVLNDEFQAATLGMVLKIDNAISDATYEAMQTIALIINRQSHTEQLVAAPEVAGGQREVPSSVVASAPRHTARVLEDHSRLAAHLRRNSEAISRSTSAQIPIGPQLRRTRSSFATNLRGVDDEYTSDSSTSSSGSSTSARIRDIIAKYWPSQTRHREHPRSLRQRPGFVHLGCNQGYARHT